MIELLLKVSMDRELSILSIALGERDRNDLSREIGIIDKRNEGSISYLENHEPMLPNLLLRRRNELLPGFSGIVCDTFGDSRPGGYVLHSPNGRIEFGHDDVEGLG